jgi:DNA-binding PadR family transcriptional regulator
VSLKFGVLGLLVERRSYGYELVQRLAERLGPAWQLKPSAVYGALDQLEDTELIRESPRGDGTGPRRDGETRRRAGRVVYEVTEKGEAAFGRWMQGASPRQEPIRSELQLKLATATEDHVGSLVEAIEREHWRLRTLHAELARNEGKAPSAWETRRTELLRDAALTRVDAELAWLANAHAALELGDAGPLSRSYSEPNSYPTEADQSKWSVSSSPAWSVVDEVDCD